MKHGLAAALFIVFINITLADDAALNQGHDGPEPMNVKAGEESPVRMVSEELEFHFTRARTAVVARFHFLNPTARTVHQAIGFPDEALASERANTEDPDNEVGPIENLKSFVDGRERASKVQFGYVKWAKDGSVWLPSNKKDKSGFLMAWHTLAVDFPPGKEIVVERHYDAPNGSAVYGIILFEYVVHTGSSWKGNIGKLHATVFLEDGLTVNNLNWTPKTDPNEATVWPKRRAWKALSPAKMVLEWDDFKPSGEKGRQYLLIAVHEKPSAPAK
ncbi:MAG TPA: DUF4424 family protein [Chthoniobacteraceae bacterium]|nr:DUF4424 family protein [Chthoniobacteraceae bacterium]